MGVRQRASILVVDDDAPLREAMGFVVAGLGFHPIAVANGDEAISWLRSGHRPAVILLDLNMPIMDGWHFREEQLDDPELATIPVIVLTARGDANNQKRRLRVAEALSKPFDLDALQQAVERVCPAASRRSIAS